MALETAVVRATTPTTSGTFDLTSTGFGTPVAALFYLVNRGSDDVVNEANAVLSVGFTDGTADRSISLYVNDAASTTRAIRGQRSAVLHTLSSSATVTLAKAGTFNSWITDGVRIDWTITSGSEAYEVIAVLIKGVSASVGTISPNSTVGLTTSVTSLGFDPDAVFFLSTGLSSGTFSTNAIFTFACAVNDGSNTQRMAAYCNEHGLATTKLNAMLATSRVGGQLFNGSLNWGAEVTAWPSGGFTLTTRDGGPGGDAIEYLALTNGGSNFSLQSVASPTSTGTQDYAVSGTPHTAIGAMTMVSGLDSVKTSSPDAEGLAVFAAQSTTGEFGADVGDDDAVSTSQAWNLFATSAIDKRYVTGGSVTAGVAADVNAWSSNVLQLNWPTVDASARYGWILIASNAGGASSGDTTDAFLVSDTHLATATTPATTSDAGLISDTQAPLATSSATTSDAGLVADAQVALATVVAATSDSILAADTQASTAAAAATTVDAALIADTQVATAAAAVTIADSGLISDTQDGAIGASTSSATTADAALMSDSFSATATVPAATSDAILVSDNQVATVVVAAVTSDSILIADVMAGSSVGGAFPIASVYTVAATAGRVTVEPASTGSVYIVGATTGLVILKGNR